MMIRKIVAAGLALVMVLGSGGMPLLAASVRILAPEGQSPVRGSVEISVGYEADSGKPVSRAVLQVDGVEYAAKSLDRSQARGVVSMLWDSTRFADGSHGLGVFLYSGNTVAAKAYAKVEVRNAGGATSGPAPAPGSDKIRFTNIRDGERVHGTKAIAVVTDSSLGAEPFIAVYVDKSLKYISNRRPFSFDLKTSDLPDGTHLVEAEVRDNSQNVLATRAIRLNVENKPGLADQVIAMQATAPKTTVTEAPTTSAEPARPRASEKPSPSVAARAPEGLPSERAQMSGAAPVAVREPAAVSPASVPSKPVEPSTSPERIASGTPPEVRPVEPIPAAGTGEPGAVAPGQPTADPAASIAAVKSDAEPGNRWGNMSATADAGEPVARPAAVPEPVAGTTPEATTASTPSSVPDPASSAGDALPMLKEPGTKPVADSARPVMMAKLDVPASVPVATEPPRTERASVTAPQVSAMEVSGEVVPSARWTTLQASASGTEPTARPQAAPAPEPAAETTIAPAPANPAASPAAANPLSPAFAQMAMAPGLNRTEPLARPTAPAKAAPAADVPSGNFRVYSEMPMVESGVSFVRLRNAVEELGGSVVWDHESKTASASMAGRQLTADLRTGIVTVDGRRVEAEARLQGSRAVLPGSAIAQAFGLGLSWDQTSRRVEITRRVPGESGNPAS